MRILLFLILLPLLLPIAAWGLFPYVFPLLATTAAKEYDVQLMQVNVQRPGLRQWNLRRVHAQLPDGTRIELAGVRLAWRLPDLKQRRLQRLDVQHIRVHPAVGADNPAGSVVIPMVVPAHVLDTMPVENWSVASLEIVPPAELKDKLHDIHTLINGSESNISVISRFRVEENAYQLTLSGRPGMRHELLVQETRDELPVLHLVDMRPHGGLQSTGRLEVELTRLGVLLEALQVGALPAALSGQTRLLWQGLLPAELLLEDPLRGVSVQGQLEIGARAIPEAGADLRVDAALQFTVADGQLSFETAPDLRVRVSHPELTTWTEQTLGGKTPDTWIQATTTTPLTGTLALRETALQLAGEVHVELHAGKKVLSHQRLKLQEALLQPDQFSARLGLTGSVQKRQAGGSMPVRELGWELAGTLSGNTEQLTFQLADSGRVRIQPEQEAGAVALPLLALQVQSNTPLTYQAATGAIAWDAVRVRTRDKLEKLAQPWLGEQDLKLQAGPVQVEFTRIRVQQGQEAEASIRMQVRDMQLQNDCCRAGPLQATVTARLNAQGMRGTAKLAGVDQSLIDATWQAPLSADEVEGELTLFPGLAFPASQKVLQSLFSPWPEPLDVQSGKTTMHGRFWWNEPEGLNADLKMQGDDFVLARDDVVVRKLSFRSEPEIRATGIGLGQYLHFHIKELDAGFPITDIQGDLWVRIPLRKRDAPVLVRHFSAKLLGGTVSAAEIPLPTGSNDVRFVLDVQGVDLAALLRLEQRKDLRGSGKLDGKIPFHWSDAGIAVDAGHLAARAPGGILQYTADASARALARTQPGLKIALDALQNFRYDVLQADLDYRQDGRLLISLKVHGENPELQGGHPVHLNITVEENVLMLLKSLQYSEEITDKIQKQMEKRNLQ